MLLDQCPFLYGQTSWLQENCIRHGNFSYVVYNSSAAERDQLLLGKLEMLAQPSRILCQAFAMTMRVRIFAFNAPRQRKQDRLSSLQFVSALLQFQKRLNPGQKFSSIHRTTQEVIRTNLDTF